MNEAQHLLAVLNAPTPQHFTPRFNERIPSKTVQEGITALKKRFGTPQNVWKTAEEGIWNVQAEKGQYQVLAEFGQGTQLSAFRVPTPGTTPAKASLTFLLLFLVPLLFARGAIGVWSEPTRLSWLLNALPSLALGGAMLAVSAWTQSSTWLAPLFWLGLGSLLVSAVRFPALPPGTFNLWDALFTTVLLLVLLPLMLKGIQGRQVPASLVPLGPVLSGGRFMVGQGGSTPTINYHVAHEHMRYAVDFIGVNGFGRHAQGLLPADPAKYAIYGADVLAPLGGNVVAVRNDLPDLPVPQADSLRPAGNHVVLQSTLADGRSVQILLAHLKLGSVRVQAGQQVHQGDVLGQVGNSGNTSEPHLHLGVNVNAEAGDPFSGEGVPFSVDGRFPVRGMVFDRQR